MCSKEMGADMVFAWPSAEIAVMGAEGAVSVISHKEIEAALDPQAKKDELIKDYKDKFANPYFAAKRGYVDSVIEPNATRNELIAGLELLENKQHPDHKGNMPL
jgi:Acetyl-CoA carboxylase, carboxyltransferase component (subunits alpha and beta)